MERSMLVVRSVNQLLSEDFGQCEGESYRDNI
jgi:hypothetical protein